MHRSVAPQPPSVGGATVVPDEYRPDALDYLCEQIMLGTPLHVICADALMPNQRWIVRKLNSDAGFKQKFIEAQRVRALTESSSLIDIADGDRHQRLTRSEERYDDERGEVYMLHHYEASDTARDKLRIDTRMKLLAKLEPTVFGDRVEHDHTVTGELSVMLAAAMNQGHRLPNGD